jgi:hypothetical protein
MLNCESVFMAIVFTTSYKNYGACTLFYHLYKVIVILSTIFISLSQNIVDIGKSQTSNGFIAERLPNVDLAIDNFRRGIQSHTGAGAKLTV